MPLPPKPAHLRVNPLGHTPRTGLPGTLLKIIPPHYRNGLVLTLSQWQTSMTIEGQTCRSGVSTAQVKIRAVALSPLSLLSIGLGLILPAPLPATVVSLLCKDTETHSTSTNQSQGRGHLVLGFAEGSIIDSFYANPPLMSFSLCACYPRSSFSTSSRDSNTPAHFLYAIFRAIHVASPVIVN